MAMVTIEDVAREAGVSVGTVSNVLNNMSSVKKVNREKVEMAIKKLNYHVNAVARMLRTNSSGYIGLIIPNVENPFFGEYARSVEKTLSNAGYSVFLCNTERDPKKEMEYINNLLEKGILGIIIGRSTLSLKELNEINKICPIALSAQEYSEEIEFPYVNINPEPGLKAAVNRIIGYGHRRIALIDGLLTEVLSDIFRSELKANGITIPAEYHRKGDFEWESGYMECIDLMRLDSPPTAIMCANDFMALGAMRAIRERGLDIPGDVSVVGFDNTFLSKMVYPTLTTINNPAGLIGEILARMIVDKIEGKLPEQSPKELVINSEFIERDSLGPVKTV